LLKQAILETGLNARIVPEGRQNLSFWRWRYLYGQAIDAFAPQPGDLKVLDGTIANPGIGGIGYEVVLAIMANTPFRQAGVFLASAHTVMTGVINQPASGGGLAFIIKPAVDGANPAGSRFILSIIQAKSLA